MIQPNPGTSPAVAAAIQRRQPTPQLSQASPTAPMMNPAPQPAPASALNKSSEPMKDQTPKAPKWEPANQQDFIVAALAESLKNSHALEKEKLKMAQQPTMGAMPQPAQAPIQAPQPQSAPMPQPAQPMPQQAPAMGGGGYGMGGGSMFPQVKSQGNSYFDMGIPKTSPRNQQNMWGF